jgi:phage terminase large subunit-like protein
MPATKRPRTRSPSSTRSRRAESSDPPELARFVRFCSKLRLAGKPFILEPFQRRILHDYFSGTRQTLVILPKKNGKSTLVAALALYHLLTTVDAEGYIAANSRQQANIVLESGSEVHQRHAGAAPADRSADARDPQRQGRRVRPGARGR